MPDAMVKKAMKFQQGVLKRRHNPPEDVSEILQQDNLGFAVCMGFIKSQYPHAK